jgi:hypothetical protein
VARELDQAKCVDEAHFGRVTFDGKATSMLPEGLVRSTAIFTEYQDFMVKQWDRENREGLARTRSAKNRAGIKPSR